jgi:hypothetical protein
MSEPITEERLERALDLLAFIIKRDGPVYMPIFNRLERELIEFRRCNQSIEERAKRLLKGSTIEGFEQGSAQPSVYPSCLL